MEGAAWHEPVAAVYVRTQPSRPVVWMCARTWYAWNVLLPLAGGLIAATMPSEQWFPGL